MVTIKKMMEKLLKDTNAPWLEYADDYQSDCAFLYFWFHNLDTESSECEAYFNAGLAASPDYQEAVDNGSLHYIQDRKSVVRDFWADRKWQWVRFWDAALMMEGSMDQDTIMDVKGILEQPIAIKFIDFAEPWIDTKDIDAMEEFTNKYYNDFKEAWIKAIRIDAPSNEDIFGNIWNLDASPDPINDIDIEEDDSLDQDEEVIPTQKVNFGGSTAWVSEVTGEIKLSKKSPGVDWMLIQGVNTGDTGSDGEILFVPNVLEGVIDWWIGLGNSDSDIKRVSKTKIIISGAGEFTKSWLHRYFFVKDKDGDLVISY